MFVERLWCSVKYEDIYLRAYENGGTDYALNQEIEADVLEQSVSAWENMPSTPSLGGRAGHETLDSRFRGAADWRTRRAPLI